MRKGIKSELCMILIGHDNQDRFQLVQLDAKGGGYRTPEEAQPVKEQFVRPSEDQSKPYRG